MKLSAGHRRGQKRRQSSLAVKAARELKAQRDAEKRLEADENRRSRLPEVYDLWGLSGDESETDLF